MNVRSLCVEQYLQMFHAEVFLREIFVLKNLKHGMKYDNIAVSEFIRKGGSYGRFFCGSIKRGLYI